MKIKLLLLAVLWSVSWATTNAQAQSSDFDEAKMKQHFQTLRDDFSTAIKNKDLKFLEKLYAKDVKYFLPSSPEIIVGRDKVLAFWKKVLPVVNYVKLKTLSVGGTKEFPYETGTGIQGRKDANGNIKVYSQSRYLVVWKYYPKEKTYKVIADCWNYKPKPRTPKK